MHNDHNNNEINNGFFEDDLINKKPNDDIVIDVESTDETVEEYNEQLYKWLSIAIIVIWLASIIYL